MTSVQEVSVSDVIDAPSPSESPLKSPQERVRAALQNPLWDWRTLEGLVKDTSLSADDVMGALEGLGSEIARGKSKDGKEVYKLRGPLEPLNPSDATLFWSYLGK